MVTGECLQFDDKKDINRQKLARPGEPSKEISIFQFRPMLLMTSIARQNKKEWSSCIWCRIGYSLDAEVEIQLPYSNSHNTVISIRAVGWWNCQIASQYKARLVAVLFFEVSADK